jgi:acylphosphatase
MRAFFGFGARLGPGSLERMVKAVEVKVRGEVQGVSFRGYAAKEAVRLELVGWVRNDPDGAVAAHFEGPDDAVDEMLDWCRRGSPSADVDDLSVEQAEVTGAESFEVDY